MAQAARLASFEGLTTQDSSGKSVARLAESWSQSSDGLTWTIKLRPTAVFHDGSPVDAAAVKASLERFLSAGNGRLSPGLQPIASIRADRPHEVSIQLRTRSSLLLDDLEVPISKLDAQGTAIGTGPYVIRSTSESEVVMTAFSKYYRGVAAIDRIVWRLYPTVRTAWAAAMRGEADFLYEVGPDSREFLASEGSVALYPFLRNYVYALVFNTQRRVFKNPEIRRALNYGVDRQALVDRAFRGHGVIANGPTWPLHWAYDSSAPTYSHDPARAAATLAATPLRFTCAIPENFELWERLGLMVQRNLAEIGVEMALESVPFSEFNRRLADRDFDAVLMETISGSSASRPFAFWHSTGLHNLFGFHNPSVDTSLEDVRQADSDIEYRQAFNRFQHAMFEDPPAIFLRLGRKRSSREPSLRGDEGARRGHSHDHQ